MENKEIEETIKSISIDLGDMSSMLNRALGAVVEELSGIRSEIAKLRKS